MPSLRDVQQWMLTVMIAPGGAEHGVVLAGQHSGLAVDDLVRAYGAADAMRRLGVYAGGYLQRLHDCIAADYPMLRQVMGEDLFGFFSRAYLWEIPSHSPTLYDLGAGFSAFLAQHRPPHFDVADGTSLLPVELARFERAWLETTRDRGPENVQGHAPSHSPWMAIDTLAWKIPPCVRLLDLQLPLIPFWQAIKAGDQSAPCPPPELSFVATSRMHYRVAAHPLTAWQFGMLKALRQGCDLHQASQRVASPQLSAEQIMADWLLWTPVAQQFGLLMPAGFTP